MRSYRYRGETKGYDPSEEELDQVLDIYAAYDDALGEPSEPLKGDGLSGELIAAIGNAFRKTQQGRNLFHLRENIMRGVGACPICGIDRAKHLDHYLPHSIFKVLAIYAHNLVPMCADCNEEKKIQTMGPGGYRFIHPYFDHLPDTPFLKATVAAANGGIDFQIGVDPAAALLADLPARINDQIKALKLNDRYAREINIYVGGHARTLHGLYPNGGSVSVSEELGRQAKYEEDRLHANDWRAVVFRALAENQEFCDGGFAEAFPLPPNVEPFGR